MTDLDPRLVGRRLRLARTALQLTQREFGDAAGIQSTAIGNYETGQRLIPPGAAVALSSAWGLTLDYIYTGELGNMQYRLAQAIQSITSLENERMAEPTTPTERRSRNRSR